MKRLVILLLIVAQAAAGSRLKELASIEGVRDNQLLGYGLVVGLAGTGDKKQTVFAAQTLANTLQKMGVQVSPTTFQVSNTAAVMITATLPPYAQPGNRIDVTVAAIGDSKNLQGGILLLTPLRAADGQVYAVGQGSVVTGGFVAGGAGNTQTVNHPTAGRIPAGAIIEKGGPTPKPGETVRLQLRRADFTTAARIAEAVNAKFTGSARPENSAAIAIRVPPAFTNREVEFIAAIESLSIEGDTTAKVIINERTGTVTMGKEVRIGSASVLHGSLTVEVQTSYEVSQPNALAKGDTTVIPKVGVDVKEQKARNIALKQGASVEELVRALLSIGSTPRDVIAILQSLRAAGALDAEIEVI